VSKTSSGRDSGEALASAHGTPFGYWLQAQGLPLDFPRLWPIALDDVVDASDGQNGRTSDDFFFFGQTHVDLIESAIRSTLQPRVVNLIPEGHGASTIARYVYDRCDRIAAERCLIPVRVSLEDLLTVEVESSDGEGVHRQRYGQLLRMARDARENGNHEEVAEEAFEDISADTLHDEFSRRIGDSIVESLLSEQWELATGRGFYAQLIGARSPSLEDLEHRRRQLRGVWSSLRDADGSVCEVGLVEGLERTVEASPVVTLPWQELMEQLFDNFQIRLSLQVDLSPSPVGRYFAEERERYTYAYEEAIAEVSAVLKNIEEETGNYLRIALFMAPGARQIFENDVNKGLEELRFPQYSELDMFTILAVHFPRHTGSKKDRKDDLASVLDSRLLHYENGKGLSTMIEDLRSRLLSMTAEEMRYQLSEAYQGIFRPPKNYLDLLEWQDQQEKWRQGIDDWKEELSGWCAGVEERVDVLEEGAGGS
jgi:hypothetical protein